MIRTLTTIAVLVLATACSYSTKKDNADKPQGPQIGLAGTTSFAALNRDLFGPLCASCHGAAHPADGVVLDSYAALMQGHGPSGQALVVPGKSSESLVYKIITAGRMPPRNKPQASAQLVTDLKVWIDAGASENALVTTVPAEPLAERPVAEPVTLTGDPTFKTVFAQILKSKCAGCHQLHENGRPAAGGVPLNDFDLLIAANADKSIFQPGDADQSALITEVLSGDMPPTPRPKLNANEVDYLKAWIAAGAPRE